MNILLIAGSTYVSALMRDRAVEAVERALQHGWGIVCADENGVSASVMEACLAREVPLLVYSIMPYPLYYKGPLECFEYLACTKPIRDELMGDMADAAIFLWNGHSQEIKHGFYTMSNRQGKATWLYDYGGLRRARVTMNAAALRFEMQREVLE